MKSRSSNAIDSHIGARIRMRRMQLGISQADLGERLGVSFQQVQKYEKGVNRVGGSRMAELASVLEVEVGFFYLGSPESKKLAKNAPGALMDDFMASKDGLMIAQAFVRIRDPRIRRTIASAILELTSAFAGGSRMQAAE